MERIIGKYTLNVTSEEINKDNFFKHSVKDRIERIEKALEQ